MRQKSVSLSYHENEYFFFSLSTPLVSELIIVQFSSTCRSFQICRPVNFVLQPLPAMLAVDGYYKHPTSAGKSVRAIWQKKDKYQKKAFAATIMAVVSGLKEAKKELAILEMAEKVRRHTLFTVHNLAVRMRYLQAMNPSQKRGSTKKTTPADLQELDAGVQRSPRKGSNANPELPNPGNDDPCARGFLFNV